VELSVPEFLSDELTFGVGPGKSLGLEIIGVEVCSRALDGEFFCFSLVSGPATFEAGDSETDLVFSRPEVCSVPDSV